MIATEAVRSWLLLNAPREARGEIERVVTSIANELSNETMSPRDYSRAQDLVAAMQQRNALNEAALLGFAESRKYEEMVAALTALTSAPLQIIAAVMRSSRHDGILVACKAVKLKWRTVEAILKYRFAHHAVSDLEIGQAKADFIILSQVVAERTLRFWKARAMGTSENLSCDFLILVKFYFLSTICASSSFELAFGDKSPDPP